MTSTGRAGTTADQLERVVDGLNMTKDKKEWMKDRWLDQVLWFDKSAARANLRHGALRIVAIAGGVLVPGLVTIASGSGSSLSTQHRAGALAFGVSLLVAIAVGLDSFFHFGERWRHFRRTAELLKTEGWLFIEGGGRYKAHQHQANFHDRFFPFFATKVEELIRRDVEVYLTRIVQEQPEDKDQAAREVRSYLEDSDGPSGQEDRANPESNVPDPSVRATQPQRRVKPPPQLRWRPLIGQRDEPLGGSIDPVARDAEGRIHRIAAGTRPADGHGAPEPGDAGRICLCIAQTEVSFDPCIVC